MKRIKTLLLAIPMLLATLILLTGFSPVNAMEIDNQSQPIDIQPTLAGYDTITVDVITGVAKVGNQSQFYHLKGAFDVTTLILTSLRVDIEITFHYAPDTESGEQFEPEMRTCYVNLIKEGNPSEDDQYIFFQSSRSGETGPFEVLVWTREYEHQIESPDFGSRILATGFEIKIKYSSAHKPAISGADTVINNVDNPYTLEQIKQIANIKAIDSYYGDITNQMQIISNSYSPNINKTGEYGITYRSTNGFGLYSDYSIIIITIDIAPPTIDGPDAVNYSYKEPLTQSQFLAKYNFSDNYDSELTISVTDFPTGTNLTGTFTVPIQVKDKSGNATNKNVTVTIFDQIAPIMTDEFQGTIQLNWRQNYPESSLKLNLTAYDEIDGDLTSKIEIKTNNLKPTQIGTYTVIYQVTDNSGNKTELTRTFEVVTMDHPIFYVSKNLLLVEDVMAMQTSDLIAAIAQNEGIELFSYHIINDEYSGNESIVGTYQLAVMLIDVNGEQTNHERTIKVFNLGIEPEVKLSFIEAVWQWIYNNIIVNVVNIFIWIWNFICNIIAPDKVIEYWTKK